MNLSKKIVLRWNLLLILALTSLSARGQWTTQNILLQPGWNAVYLEVQPQPSDCDTALAGLGVEKVWGWNRRFSAVQYVPNATSLLPSQPDWLFYVPVTNAMAAQQSLYHLEGGKCYLIKLPDNAAPRNWSVLGQPSLRKLDWVPNSLNMVGFSLDLAKPPTFTQFFAPSPAQAGNPVYRLGANGAWTQITNLSSATMRSGEAFWIQCTGASVYQGPLALTVPQRTGLTYGSESLQQNLTVQNLSGSARSLIFTLLPSANPPAGDVAPLAGPVPLSYHSMDLAGKSVAWLPFSAVLTQSNLPAGQSVELQWAVRRPDMIPNQSGPGAVYQSLLEIRDAAGSSRLVIPVTANGLDGGGQPLSSASGGTAVHPGLWIGSASINLVNQPNAEANPNLPTKTGSPFEFRLLLHAGSNDSSPTNVIFMQRVLQMWRNGTFTNNSSGFAVVDQPGNYILLTDENYLNILTNISGAAMRDGQFVGRRVSSAAFGFRNPLVMTNGSGSGQFGVASNVYNCTVSIPAADPLNPFRHLYHPEHSNTNNAGPLQPVNITRQIQLTFTATDPDNLAQAGWGDKQIGGIYRETIIGLQWQTNFIQGTFRLTLATPVTGLNGNP